MTLRRIAIVIVASIIAVVISEGLARLIFPPSPSFDQVIANSLRSPARLYAPKIQVSYDVSGLYQGANRVLFRTSRNGFIEPEPDFPARYRVLFLGGSTTEALYVPENERWVARLNDPGEIAAYNAGQSGANTLDHYFTFLHLTWERGLTFDLVILITALNDFGWERRLSRYGGSLRLSQYRHALAAWYRDEYQKDERWWTTVRHRVRLVDVAGRAGIGRLVSSLAGGIGQAPSVAMSYQRQRENAFKRYGGRSIRLSDCQAYEAELNRYTESVRTNMSMLAGVVAGTGAKLLVVSEPTSDKAPAASFYRDLRYPLTCDEAVLSNEDAHRLNTEINRRYLHVAREIGALTFDLAANLDPYSNGAHGGTYMYDGSHYSPEGSALVAGVLRRVIRRILEKEVAPSLVEIDEAGLPTVR